MALMVTEDWIRRRVDLKEQRLADVRSLFLPGSYEEKITHLGKSLKNFTRLKTLDLSRNSLVTLEGIQHLIHLEKLNLYYNKIASLKEIFLLRNLGCLKELDLRLNPVSKNETDYRLFVVHMLPNLRRLDDRPIRDSERKAALMHFTSDQAHEFQDCLVEEEDNERSRHLRAEFVKSLTKKCTELDEDDEAVLNLIAKCGWDLSKYSGITGSAKSVPEAKLHNLKGIREIDGASENQEPVARNTLPSTRSLSINIPKAIANSQKKGSTQFQAFTEGTSQTPGRHLANSMASCTFAGSFPSNDVNGEKERTEDQFIRLVRDHPAEMLKLLGGQSSAALSVPASHSNQTGQPHTRRHPTPQKPGGDDRKGNATGPKGCETVQSMSTDLVSIECGRAAEIFFNTNLMNKLLDLVDRYWNGSKSLHCNETFLKQARKMMCGIHEQVALENQPEETKKLQEGINDLRAKNETLENCLCQQKQQYTEEFQKLSVQLTQAQRDMEIMKDCLGQTLDEKNHLQNHLIKLEQKALNTSSSKNQQVEELQNHNQKLQCEIDNLKQKAQYYTKIQELVDKLQESHRVLVCTNEHLLTELNEARSRHKAEVGQLHWSYIQLKKTMEPSPCSVTASTSDCMPLGREIKSQMELEHQKR
ncbi:centrosomal protein of 72 kDa isoform X2 [Chiloscyllium punctatum]|uniref:centrosomal protein of 72 kDa isoform X2 n=1 Tax=Chiloscyllium punctatum TaxID=137246 RepID=UPI003B63E914